MSYDLDEAYINARKTEITTLEGEIEELDKLQQVYRVEAPDKRNEIREKIVQSRITKNNRIRALIDEIWQHCKDVIWP